MCSDRIIISLLTMLQCGTGLHMPAVCTYVRSAYMYISLVVNRFHVRQVPYCLPPYLFQCISLCLVPSVSALSLSSICLPLCAHYSVYRSLSNSSSLSLLLSSPLSLPRCIPYPVYHTLYLPSIFPLCCSLLFLCSVSVLSLCFSLSIFYLLSYPLSSAH
jgi:hypothetical protein